MTTALVLLSLWPLRILAFRLSARTGPEEAAWRSSSGGHERRLRARGGGERGADVSSLEFEEEGDSRRVDVRVRLGRQDRRAADRRPHPGRSSPRRTLEPLRAVRNESSLASASPGKLRELRRALPTGRSSRSMRTTTRPRPVTYYENALAKARFGRERERGKLGAGRRLRSRSRRPRRGAGDQVRPVRGRHARRAAACRARGRRRRARGARYVCELVALSPDGEEHRGTGILEGRIAEQPCGSEGFGFDPVFIPEGEERTAAEPATPGRRGTLTGREPRGRSRRRCPRRARDRVLFLPALLLHQLISAPNTIALAIR